VAGGDHRSNVSPTIQHHPLPQPIEPKSAELLISRSLKPWQQGEFDSLCGIYAILNALQLAMAPYEPLSPTKAKQLFRFAIGFLEQRKDLGAIVEHGMVIKRQRQLLKYLLPFACTETLRVTGMHFEARHKNRSRSAANDAQPSIEQLFSWMSSEVAKQRPVLICLHNTLNHYSVVSGIDHSRIQLFDSDNHRYVNRSSCGVDSGLHHITPSALTAIVAEPRATSERPPPI
jgi:hypothetical protein